MATKAANGKTDMPTSADLTDQIEVIRNDISALTQLMADLGKGKANAAAAQVKATAGDAQDRVSADAETARDQAAKVQDQAQDFVRNQPATALGIAAGVGFLIGVIGARRA